MMSITGPTAREGEICDLRPSRLPWQRWMLLLFKFFLWAGSSFIGERWSDGCEATAFTLKRSPLIWRRQREIFKEGGDPGVTSPPLTNQRASCCKHFRNRRKNSRKISFNISTLESIFGMIVNEFEIILRN